MNDDYEEWLKSQITVAKAWMEKEESAETRKMWAMEIACDETNLEMYRLLRKKASESSEKDMTPCLDNEVRSVISKPEKPKKGGKL